MKATAKRRSAASAPQPRRRKPAKEMPYLARCEVRVLPRMEAALPPPSVEEPQPVADDWEPPVLRGGTAWVGGSLRREDMYDDDGR